MFCREVENGRTMFEERLSDGEVRGDVSFTS
jgi:hypothetical protein